MAGHLPNSHPSGPASLDGVAAQLLNAALTDSSNVTYLKGITKFRQFVTMTLNMNNWFPAEPYIVMLYIAHLYHKGYATSTIISAVSIISYYHKVYMLLDSTTAFVIKKTLQGVSNLQPTRDLRLPITIQMLDSLVDATKQVATTHYHSLLLTAMFLLAFHAFLRISEFALPSSGKSDHILQLSNISIHPDEVLIQFNSFKHHRGHPVSISVPSHVSYYCPVKHLAQFLLIRGTSPGPLFIFPDETPVTQGFFRSSLRACLSLAGFSNATYTSHSFRIGAATEAARKGYSDDEIQRMGRWSSTAFKKYIRIPKLSLA